MKYCARCAATRTWIPINTAARHLLRLDFRIVTSPAAPMTGSFGAPVLTATLQPKVFHATGTTHFGGPLRCHEVGRPMPAVPLCMYWHGETRSSGNPYPQIRTRV